MFDFQVSRTSPLRLQMLTRNEGLLLRTPPECYHPLNLHLVLTPRSTLRLMTLRNGGVVARHPDSRGGGRAMPKVSRLHFYRPKVGTLVPADGAFLCLTLSLSALCGQETSSQRFVRVAVFMFGPGITVPCVLVVVTTSSLG